MKAIKLRFTMFKSKFENDILRIWYDIYIFFLFLGEITEESLNRGLQTFSLILYCDE